MALCSDFLGCWVSELWNIMLLFCLAFPFLSSPSRMWHASLVSQRFWNNPLACPATPSPPCDYPLGSCSAGWMLSYVNLSWRPTGWLKTLQPQLPSSAHFYHTEPQKAYPYHAAAQIIEIARSSLPSSVQNLGPNFHLTTFWLCSSEFGTPSSSSENISSYTRGSS